MVSDEDRSRFRAKLLRPAIAHPDRGGNEVGWAFVVLPKTVSDSLPRRGRTTVVGRINGVHFQAMLEPDGQLSHWLQVDAALLKHAGVGIGDIATFEVRPVEQEPEPTVPHDLKEALSTSPMGRENWDATTTIARVDWIHWITSAKQSATRAKRIRDACEMLADGKKRVCCFDPSGFYSKAFGAPKSAKADG